MLRNLFNKKLPSVRTKMVFLVRTDLAMGKGKVASQVAHASICLYKQAVKERNPYLDMWLTFGQPKIVLKASSEKDLLEVHRRALDHSLNVCKVLDGGKTQIERGSLTVVGIGPNRVEDIDEVTREFKLL
ncbi:peptidyl-tRNA hydrolase 2, mitochondrial [Anthonomus grandis grandis]|uniref:peptidyl-tRNA hydrolase 2, mitochondrial n=1 Tax=Anthonomus grandis grandis TaxID=2921223 RepID=UPI00216593FB|nr:peptidyl-tRNA hydrolase 2, mitochondrial [Anthonomus grandis grandis]